MRSEAKLLPCFVARAWLTSCLWLVTVAEAQMRRRVKIASSNAISHDDEAARRASSTW